MKDGEREPPEQGSLADILSPLAIEAGDEDQLTRVAHGLTLANLAEKTDRALAIVQARTQILEKVRAASIVMTQPENWTLFKDPEGREKAHLGADGAYAIMDLWGVEVFNLRGPDDRRVAEPVLIKEPDGTWTAVIIGDGRARFTNRTVEGLAARANSKEEFVGRNTGAAFISEAVMLSDLKATARTRLDSKFVRVLTGTANVPVEILKSHGLKTELCTKGKGYGSSAARRADRQIDPDLLSRAEAFWKSIVGYCVGDEAAALTALAKVSEFTEKDKNGKILMVNGQPKMKRPAGWRDLVASGSDRWLTISMERFKEMLEAEEKGISNR